VITFLQFGNHGRLGNQLFQYAMMKAVATKNNFELKLPNIDAGGISYFDLECESLEPDDIHRVSAYFQDEPKYHFLSDVFDQRSGTNFHGYFQSERYFKSIEEQIRKEFQIKDKDLRRTAMKKLLAYQNFNLPIVSVHVRRGDYLTIHNGQYHGVCPIEYYRKAMASFGEAIFIVFSDSIEWCKQNIVGPRVFYSEGNSPILDFATISLCDHNIIANSSFSWWAAWLNKNDEKRVVAPEKWFAALGPSDIQDLIPPNWEKMWK